MTEGNAQPPGWYQAEGDPPGTQRWWDGGQWQGGPQPVPAPAAVASGPGGRAPAENGPRFVAYLIDTLLVVAVYIAALIVGAIAGAVSDGLGVAIFLLGVLAAVGVAIYNQLYLQGTTGQTIGKKQQGITLLSQQTGQPVGPGMTFVRLLLQGVFSIPCYLDHFWILFDKDRQRLSDKVLDYHVYTA